MTDRSDHFGSQTTEMSLRTLENASQCVQTLAIALLGLNHALAELFEQVPCSRMVVSEVILLVLSVSVLGHDYSMPSCASHTLSQLRLSIGRGKGKASIS